MGTTFISFRYIFFFLHFSILILNPPPCFGIVFILPPKPGQALRTSLIDY